MYTRMLIPLDGSKTAEKVLPYARSLAGKLGLPIELLTVIEVPEIVTHMTRHMDSFLEGEVTNSERYLDNISKSFLRLSVKCAVQKGQAADDIIENAESAEGTMIAMATHGRSGINRWLLGSVAEKVLRGSGKPLLLVRATEAAKSEGEAGLKRLVVPLDGSELAECVIPTVVDLASALKLEVLLIRAFKVPASVYAGGEGYYGIDYEKLHGEYRDDAHAYLENKASELRRQGLDRISFVSPEGLAADEIISLARRTPDNLIAMCTHGRSGLTRWALGSVTENVVRHAGGPVLVVRAV
jgi:nucleotide-binding universal stress UspA family protein